MQITISDQHDTIIVVALEEALYNQRKELRAAETHKTLKPDNTWTGNAIKRCNQNITALTAVRDAIKEGWRHGH